MRCGGTFLFVVLGAAAIAAACGSGNDGSKVASGTGGTSSTGGEQIGGGGEPPDPTPFCAQICQLMAAVDCTTGTAVPVDGDQAVPVDDPTCVDEWCTENTLAAEVEPDFIKPCQREWDAFLECMSKLPADAYGCYGIAHTTVDPEACVYPELEDYNNCFQSGGPDTYPPPQD
ncbi:MAG TPA: hypothetical protein VMI54_05360 [Polyangiaceae bacterium]|nr:hypothetical protein [Polyangiaceae bacterium]